MMKNIKFKLLSFLAIIVLIAGCTKDWLDINHDPNEPSEAKVNLLLPGIEYDIADYFSMGYQNLGYKTGVYTHQIVTRESTDAYGISGGDINYWDYLYEGPLTDLDKIIEIGTEKDYMKYVGIAKILKAYTYSQIVDIFGDVPFSQVNNPDFSAPAFDKDEDIYPQLFTMIDEGIADLKNNESVNLFSPAANDLIYGGDIEKWEKAANTLKLKLYNQIRKTSLFDAEAVTALLSKPLIEKDEDFMFWFSTGDNPENRNPGMADEYSGSQISTYISPWFFEIMSGKNPDIFNGITDPRIPYYWCNQSGGTTENDPEYMDGDFVSIYFGSTGPNSDASGRSTFTMVGFYPCGGRYDDGTFTDQLKGEDAAGDAPMRFITYADRLFIEAELALEEGITTNGNARDRFSKGMIASFDLIDNIIANSATDQIIPTFGDLDTDESYELSVLTKYDAATPERQLELIMTEKWIQSWGSNIDSYTDYRRTGYPKMFDANSNGGIQSGGPDGSGPTTTQCTRGYVVSFPYPNSELETNTNAPAQKNITTDKIFWDK